MFDFSLQVFLKINGVGAASGIFYKDENIYLVSDNSNYLYTYSIPKNTLNKYLLIENQPVNEAVPKAAKLDIEALFEHNNELYLIGSASKNNRNFMFNVSKSGLVNQLDLTATHEKIRETVGIDLEDYNIEGAFLYQDYFYFLNRGNGPNKNNGIIRIDQNLNEKPTYQRIDLQTDSGEQPMFTDAIQIEKKIYFIAAAEESNSTYDDGEVTGSYFGVMNMDDFQVQKLIKISNHHKFEGITILHNNEQQMEFLLCEDPDNDLQQTSIYKLIISK